jgi:phytoene desaturase
MAGKKVSIIGAGFGGLSAAIKLAHAGYDVHVYEQNNCPGGKANIISEQGYRFDTGPTLLIMPNVLEGLFENVNENLNNYIDLIRLDTICKYFWGDGTTISAHTDIRKFARQLEKGTNDSQTSILNFLNYAKRIHDLTADMFLYGDFANWRAFLNNSALRTLFSIRKIDPFRTIHQANKSFFTDPKTVQLFDRYATYQGASPYNAPATLNMIPHVEYGMGAFVPAKGIYSLVDSLHSLARNKGVHFHYKTAVREILIDRRRVKGLLVSGDVEGDKVFSDVVISNADVSYTYNKLVGPLDLSSKKRYKKLGLSSSALIFYWAVDGIHDQLEIHNILFSKDYRKEFIDIFDRRICPDDPTVYIYISSKYNANDALPGKENWFVMINAPCDADQDWGDEINRMREIIKRRVKDYLGIDLSRIIIFEKVMSPIDIENKTSSHKGAIYGISANHKNAAFIRQKNRSREIKGLYFSGGSAHPGGGIPLAILSGNITADLIMKYEK